MEIKYFVVGPLLTNCYLLISTAEAIGSKDEIRFQKMIRRRSERRFKEAALIDPGGQTKEIFEELEKTQAILKYIILTHGHWDHTFSVGKVKEKTGAEILIHEAEKEFIKFKADRFLKDGDKIKIGASILKVVHTPGHTKGSICLLAENAIFTGDTIFKDGYGRTDLKGGSQKDLENSLEKLEKILKPPHQKFGGGGKPGMKIYPGHGQIFEFL